MGLSFTIAAGPSHRSHSQIRVQRDPWPYFTVSDSRLSQPGGSRPRIYIPQEQGGPIIPPGTGLLTGLPVGHSYIISARTVQKTPLPRTTLFLRVYSLQRKRDHRTIA
jgi:hypothetical protein